MAGPSSGRARRNGQTSGRLGLSIDRSERGGRGGTLWTHCGLSEKRGGVQVDEWVRTVWIVINCAPFPLKWAGGGSLGATFRNEYKGVNFFPDVWRITYIRTKDKEKDQCH